MTELAVAEKPSQQEKTAALELEKMGKGIANINCGYPLHEVIAFIKKLGVSASVWTSQPERALEIPFPTPTLFGINGLEKFNSAIFITGQLKEHEPDFTAGGKRQVWRPTCFVAAIKLNNNSEKHSKVREIILSTELSRKELNSAIKKAVDEIPQNWQFKAVAISKI